MTERKFKSVGLFFFTLLLWWPFHSHSAEPKRGGSLRFGVQKSITALNPFVHNQSVNARVRSLIYESILAEDQDLATLPSLARSWTVSPDGMIYTFTLRRDVKFHNGKPLTLEDVKWSIEYAQNPKNRAWGQRDLTIIKRIELEEPDQLRLHLKSPMAPFLSMLSGQQRLPVLPKDALETSEKPKVLPPGTGPFRFGSWRPAQELKLVRFDDYWKKGLPYLDEVRFVFGLDDTSRLNAVRAGDLDISEEIPEEQIIRMRNGELPGINLVVARAGNHPRMGINHCKPPFNNVKVRQAVTYALDKQEILDGAFAGLGIPTNQKLVKGTQWFVSDVPDRKQDLEKAKALLAEAGYPDGFKLTIPGSQGTQKVLQVIQSQLRKVGIDATIIVEDQASHLASLNKADFQLSMSGGSTNSDPDLAYYGYYHTPRPGARRRGGRNQPCYSNPKVDRLLEEGRSTTDFQKRREIYRELVKTLQEDVADIPLGFVPNGYALQPYVKGFEPTIKSTFSYANGGVLKTWMDR